MTRPSRGFTLVELALVVIIIVILAFQGPDVFEQVRGSKYKRAVSDMAVFESGFWGFNEDSNAFVGDLGINGVPPDGTEFAGNISTDLVSASTPTYFAPRGTYLGVTYGWNGPYTGFGLNPQLMNNDPWQNPYQFTKDGRIWSYGADGQANTTDDIWSPSPPGNYPFTNPPAGGGPLLLSELRLTTPPDGSLLITVYDSLGVQITQKPLTTPNSTTQTNLQVIVYNPQAGTTPKGQLGAVTATWTTPGNYFLASGLWPGQHAVEVIGSTSVTSGTAGGCNGQADVSQQFSPEALGLITSTTGTTDCIGVYGHTIGYVLGGSTSTVKVRVH